MDKMKTLMKPYLIGGAVGGLALLGILVLTGMMHSPSAADVKAIETQNTALKTKIDALEAEMSRNGLAPSKGDDGMPKTRPTANEGDEKKRDRFGRPDALSFHCPPVIAQVPFGAKHAMGDCCREFGETARASYDGVLFGEPGQKLHVASVAGFPQFHLHLITEAEKGGKIVVTKDEVVPSNAQGILEIPLATDLPSKVVVVMPPATIDYPGGTVVMLPYTATIKILPASSMQAVLSAQDFVTAIAPGQGQTPELFASVTPRSDREFVFGAYSIGGKHAVANGLYVCSGERYVLQPTFRFMVASGSDVASVTNKVEILGYPDNVSFQAAGSFLFDLEEQGAVLAKLPCPERPLVSIPPGHEALPHADVAATFYGLRANAKYRLVQGVGQTRGAELRLSSSLDEFAGDRQAVTQRIEADKSAGDVVPGIASYMIRVHRVWNMTGGCIGCRVTCALSPGGPAHQHEPFIGAHVMIHMKVIRLGGMRPAAAPNTFAPLLAGMLADDAVRAALGMPKYEAAPGGEGGGGLGNNQKFNTNIYVNSGGGGIGPDSGAGGGASNSGKSDFYLSSNGVVTPWSSPWSEINRQLNQQSMDQIRNGETGRTLPGIGWQSHFNAPRPEGAH